MKMAGDLMGLHTSLTGGFKSSTGVFDTLVASGVQPAMQGGNGKQQGDPVSLPLVACVLGHARLGPPHASPL